MTPTGSQDPDGNDIWPGRTLERPKVIYNEETQKWVMWIHWENGEHYGDAKVCVAYSDKIEGPYTFYKTFRPNGHDSRDQTLFKDTDGKAYHFGSTDMNTNMLVSELDKDFLEVTGNETKILMRLQYEAPAIFKVGDIYYGLFSGCTGWDPNPGHTTYSYEIMGEWITGDNFCIDNGRETTYRSQSTYVFQVDGYENAFVYMGDRWVSTNPGSSNVVWLPLSIRSGYPTVKWRDSWDLSVFEDWNRYKRAKEIIPENNYLLLDKTSDRFISRNASGDLVIADDDETKNINFHIIRTEKSYTYKIQETDSGNFLESFYGALRLSAESEAESQEWLFILQEDGYYHIKNKNEDKYLAVSGNETLHNTSLYLSNEGRARSFALYFDSGNFLYEEAEIYTIEYHAEIKRLVQEQTDFLTSMEDIYTDSKEIIELYPSVNTGRFSLSSSSTAFQDKQVELILYEGMTGKQMYTTSEYLSGNSTEIDWSGKLAEGIYLLKIISGNKVSVKKMIVKFQ